MSWLGIKLYTMIEHIDGERHFKLVAYRHAQVVKVWLLRYII